MGGIVTAPPTLIDAVQHSTVFVTPTNGQLYNHFLFPIDPNGITAYMVLVGDFEEFAPILLHIFKTADRGATWTLMDDVHAPTTNLACMGATFDAGTGLIYLAYADDNAFPLVPIINTFNTATDLYGTENTSSTDAMASGGSGPTGPTENWQLIYNSGILWLFSGFRSISYAKFHTGGGTWDAANYFVGTGVMWLEVLFDSVNGVFQFFGPNLTFGPTRVNLRWQTMNLAEVFTDHGFIFTSVGVPSPQVMDGGQLRIINGTTLAVPFTPRDDFKVRVALGTPLNAPVWTIVEMDPTGSTIPSGPSPYLFPAVVQHNTDLLSYWTAGSGISDGLGKIWQNTSTDGGATWGVPILFYDQATNPPPLPVSPPETKTPQSINVDPCWLLGTVMGKNYAYSLETIAGCAAPPPVITILCPPNPSPATIGVFYNSGAPVVMGGVGPYTFTIVNGSLPPGYMLDPNTGVVSGITFVTGIFHYTLEVTDSSSPPISAIVDAPCPINVGGGSGTGPCVGVIAHPETDVGFKLEKVIATLKPVTHLPVRGSVK